jgi:2-polyprenyl-6-methoxyphenol hydroxylase-like FAD-dependent oxidoreductase
MTPTPTAERRHAVVLGGSIAGLLAARVLADRYAAVTIVERDGVRGVTSYRRGVPQARHAHGLLPGGAQALERLFPGLQAELVASGAARGDLGADTVWFHYGGYKQRPRSGLVGTLQSRVLLEAAIRRRVLDRAGVRLLERHDAEGLVGVDGRVTGVRLRPVGGEERTLAASLVVDATGRGSQAPRWLAGLGFEAPAEALVTADIGYTTRHLRREPGDAGGADAVLINPTPPHERRFGVLLAQEDDRWVLTLGGWLGDHAPSDEAGFQAFAESLPAPDIADILRGRETLDGPYVHRMRASRRRLYEKLSRHPLGLLVIGDAVCSFNPVYGQGMSSAALQAEALARGLDEARTEERLAGSYYRAVARIVDNPWSIGAGAHQVYPDAAGERPLPLRLVNRYVARVHRAAIHDEEVQRAFLQVMSLLAPPPSLMRPALALRVLRASRRDDPPWPRTTPATA